MPTVDLKPKSFSVWSNLQLPADQFEAEIVGVDRFEAANRADRVDLTTGFYDSSGTPHTIGKLKKGLIQEYVVGMAVAKGEVKVTSQVRGFDQAALLLETQFNKRYLRAPHTDPISTSAEDAEIPSVTGVFSASDIAREAAEAAGLTLRWEAPDYVLQTDFFASGRAIDTIYALVRPYQLCEPFKVDVLLFGDVVVVHERTPDLVAPPDTNVFSIKDARIKNINVRRKRAIKYGKIKLRGCPKMGTPGTEGPSTTYDASTGGLVFVAFTVTKETSGGGMSASMDGNGVFVSEKVTYRMPDQILLFLQRTTYVGGSRSATETSTYEWEPSQYDLTGPINKPKQLSQHTEWDAYAGNPQRYQTVKTEDTKFEYDDQGFLKRTSVYVRTVNQKTEKLENSEMRVVTVNSLGDMWVEQVSATLKWDKKNEKWGSPNVVANISGGHKPGGPARSGGPGFQLAGTEDMVGHLEESMVEATLSTDADAINIDESFPQMDEAALAVILDRLTRAHNMAEFEADIRAKSIPWMGRAEIIEFTGCETPNGEGITLQPMLIFELRADYKEGRGMVSLDSTLKAVFWKSEA